MCINMNWLEMGKELIYNILTPEEDKPKFANDENDKKQSQKKRKVISLFDFKPLIYIQLQAILKALMKGKLDDKKDIDAFL